jgi:HAMP domain-containing protein
LFSNWKNAFPIRFAWAAVAAALVAVILFVAERRVALRSEPPSELRATQPHATTVPRATLSDNVPSGNAQPGNVIAKSTARRRNETKSRPQFAGSKEQSAAVANSSFSAGFQNLMYCDALSCSGAMEVIRMQLPVAAMNRDPALQQRNGIVLADVLIGSDGIARAIRIVN